MIRRPPDPRNLFQSAPLTEARGDVEAGPRSRAATAAFQSAPLTEARGDALVDLFGAADRRPVSIRSPHRSEGRFTAGRRGRGHSILLFQSAPLTEARGDAQGIRRWGGQALGVSIRSPHRSEGRSEIGRREGCRPRVSIRSPHRSEGRSRTLGVARQSTSSPPFQSAPLTEARGDNTSLTGIVSRNLFQSAPLTEARGDRCAMSDWYCSGAAFQSAPLTEARGDPRAARDIPVTLRTFQSAPLTEARGDTGDGEGISAGRRSGFNPLPSPKRGEIRCGPYPVRLLPRFNPLPSPKRGEISIEISIVSQIAHRVEQFQSAPLTEARGDTLTLHRREPFQSGRSSRFNPLPSPKRGEIRLQRVGLRRLELLSFQSAPLTEARGDAGETGAELSRRSQTFQSAPLTEARGDAGCSNQQNNKGLHRPMRDSVKSLPGRA